MIKLFLKTTFLTLLVCSCAVFAKAQLGFNYSQWDVGTSVGFNSVFGDASPSKTTASVNFNFTYNQTPFTNFVFEAQLGKLTGGDSLHTKTGRFYNNDFFAFTFRGQLQFGEFLDYSRSPFFNAMKNAYISAGIGLIQNHITQVNRTSIQDPAIYTGGLNWSREPFLPLRIGYEFKLYNQNSEPSVRIDVGYEVNFVFGDEVDGFATGAHNDIFTQISLGVKFAIGGGVTSYRKQITY